jgi:hypothetical protein
MCSLDMPVSQPSVLPKDICSTTTYDIPDVSVQHWPLLSLDVCGQQKFVLSLSLNFACSVNISCAAIKMHFFIYFYFYYIYNFCKIVSWAGEGEYPGKLLARNRYINRRIPG